MSLIASNSLCGDYTIGSGRTISDLESSYTPAITGTPTILGAMAAAGITTIPTSGLQTTDINTIIGKLTNLYPADLPSNPTDADISGYMIHDAAFVAGIKSEYCYYFQRYADGINQLLDSVINSNSKDNSNPPIPFADPATGGDGLNTACQKLNVKLNNIVYFVQGVGQLRRNSIPTITTELNTLNMSLSNASQDLAKQQKILTSAQTNVQLYKEMEQYSREKSKYTNNMLMLYSFLNITALGLLFYIYRSAGK
jgi:hypothetical protein